MFGASVDMALTSESHWVIIIAALIVAAAVIIAALIVRGGLGKS
jgi:hypothetical protein